MTIPECTHGMPSPVSCVQCMYEGPVAEPAPQQEHETIGLTITARYDGDCSECSLPITVGQLVHRMEPSGRYVHAYCFT